MNYYNKYLKYKNKYNDLKGGILSNLQISNLKEAQIPISTISEKHIDKYIYTSEDIDDYILKNKCPYKNTEKIIDCKYTASFNNHLGTCWMLSIFMILIVGDNTSQCFQNAILLSDENELSEKTLLNLQTFLPSYFFENDNLKITVRNLIIEFKTHFKQKFFVYTTNSMNKEYIIENTIKQDVCEEILATLFEQIFNIRVLGDVNIGGSFHSDFFLLNFLSSLYLEKLIKYTIINTEYINVDTNFKDNIGVLITTITHTTCFYKCNNIQKFCSNNLIIDYNWDAFFSKIIYLNNLDIAYKLYDNLTYGPFIYTDEESNTIIKFNNIENTHILKENDNLYVMNDNTEIRYFSIISTLLNYTNYQQNNIQHYLRLIIILKNSIYLEQILNRNNSNLKFFNGQSILSFAIENGCSMCVKIILKMGGNPNEPFIPIWNIRPPLIEAINIQSETICKDLLYYGADPNIYSYNNNIPLIVAVYVNNINIFKLLLNNGADPNLYNNIKQTPLFIAVSEINIILCKLLLNNGADPNLDDYMGRTPLFIAVRKLNIPLCELLLSNGANPNLDDSMGTTPLFIAVREQNIPLCKLLLSNGADPNHKNTIGNTPLLIATKNNNIEIINIISTMHTLKPKTSTGI